MPPSLPSLPALREVHDNWYSRPKCGHGSQHQSVKSCMQMNLEIKGPQAVWHSKTQLVQHFILQTRKLSPEWKLV